MSYKWLQQYTMDSYELVYTHDWSKSPWEVLFANKHAIKEM